MAADFTSSPPDLQRDEGGMGISQEKDQVKTAPCLRKGQHIQKLSMKAFSAGRKNKHWLILFLLLQSTAAHLNSPHLLPCIKTSTFTAERSDLDMFLQAEKERQTDGDELNF